MKVCTRCKIEKDDSAFRVRHEKRESRSRGLLYLNNTCRQCDSEIQQEYYAAKKHDESFKQQNRERSKRYIEENRDIVRERKKLERQTPQYKEMRERYRERNKERIMQQERIIKKRYADFHCKNLTDEYIITRLISWANIKREHVTPELIEMKRLEIQFERLLREKAGWKKISPNIKRKPLKLLS